MESKEKDLFGNPATTGKQNSRNGAVAPKINPCVTVFGAGPAEMRCKHCKQLYAKFSGSKYFKCKLRKDTKSITTDHRANWPTCAKFEAIEPTDDMVRISEADVALIKHQLEQGQHITVQSVLRSIGTQELRTYVPILRRKFNLNIGSRWMESRGKRFKEYYLLPPAA